jgi:hypothetical protein
MPRSPWCCYAPFGTSHSTSTTRSNALVTATHGAHRGHGEAGLPPLKPSVYHSDYGCLWRALFAAEKGLGGAQGVGAGGGQGGQASGQRHRIGPRGLDHGG